jgi:hypothetical protein
MKKLYIPFLVSILTQSLSAQVFQVDTIMYNGSTDRYINFVVMGDGYTATQQDTFVKDAAKMMDYLLTQSPWNQYAAYFNVFAIRVISNETGIKHPVTASDCPADVPFSNPDNYFGTTFDYGGIHRLIVPVNSAKIGSVLADNFPDYDQVMVIGNTPVYGGSGGAYATGTLHPSSNEIMAHEVGHSFAKLSDEYYAGDGYARELVNMTQETDTLQVKWKNWIGYNGTGIYQHCCGGNSAKWYRPHQNCKMRFLNSPYCSVCSETIVESIHGMVNPLLSYSPESGPVSSSDQLIHFRLLELMLPVPNTLKTTWTLDGNMIGNHPDSLSLDQLQLSSGAHVLTAMVTDTTAFVRKDSHSNLHASVVSWTINVKKTGISVLAASNKISCSMYPNPAGATMQVSIDLEKSSHVSVTIVSADGKTALEVMDKTMEKGKLVQPVNTGKLAPGVYLVVFRIGEVLHTERLVIQ